jgi:hypothetical protein
MYLLKSYSSASEFENASSSENKSLYAFFSKIRKEVANLRSGNQKKNTAVFVSRIRMTRKQWHTNFCLRGTSIGS